MQRQQNPSLNPDCPNYPSDRIELDQELKNAPVAQLDRATAF